jgi:hypothetical protein
MLYAFCSLAIKISRQKGLRSDRGLWKCITGPRLMSGDLHVSCPSGDSRYCHSTTGWTFRGSSLSMNRRFFLLRNVCTSSAVHPASCSLDAGVLSRGENGRRVMLTTHFHVALRLRMSRATPVVSLYSFMAMTGTTLPVPLF